MFTCQISTFQFIYSIFIYIAAMTAAIQMVTDMNTVAETVASVQVCAEITGLSIAGMLECAVTNTPMLTGSSKASMLIKATFLFPFIFTYYSMGCQ